MIEHQTLHVHAKTARVRRPRNVQATLSKQNSFVAGEDRRRNFGEAVGRDNSRNKVHEQERSHEIDGGNDLTLQRDIRIIEGTQNV